jgi:hypothetical protein
MGLLMHSRKGHTLETWEELMPQPKKGANG